MGAGDWYILWVHVSRHSQSEGMVLVLFDSGPGTLCVAPWFFCFTNPTRLALFEALSRFPTAPPVMTG